MPNWCSTNVYISHKDERAIEDLYNKIKEWTSKNYMDNGFGHSWIGNVVLGSGIGTVDTNINTDVRCRGNVEYMDCEDNKITIQTGTAWSPLLKVWLKVIDKYLPDAELVYDAYGIGFELFVTNDPCLIGKYNIDPFDFNEIDCNYDASEDDVIGMLQDLLHTKECNIDILMRKFHESDYADKIAIHKWEYLDPREFD